MKKYLWFLLFPITIVGLTFTTELPEAKASIAVLGLIATTLAASLLLRGQLKVVKTLYDQQATVSEKHRTRDLELLRLQENEVLRAADTRVAKLKEISEGKMQDESKPKSKTKSKPKTK